MSISGEGSCVGVGGRVIIVLAVAVSGVILIVIVTVGPMPRVLYDTAMTLNGLIADEHHSLDWLFAVEPPSDAVPLYPVDAAVLVEGATTYEWVLRQENLLDRPHRWAELYGQKPVFVLTHRDLPIPSGADVRLVSGAVAELIPRIRDAAAGGDVWVVGGGDVAGQFFDAGAITHVNLSCAPASLARGVNVLPRTIHPDRLRLLDARKVGQFARLCYEVLPEAQARGF